MISYVSGFSQTTLLCSLPKNDPTYISLKQKHQQELQEISIRYKTEYFLNNNHRADGKQACKSHKILDCSSCKALASQESDLKEKERLASKKNFYAAVKKREEEYCAQEAKKMGMTDEEKLNQALLDKMEKQFDDEHKEKKESVSTNKSPTNKKNETTKTDNSKEVYIFTQGSNDSPYKGAVRFKNKFLLIKSSVIFKYGRVSEGILAEDVSFKLDNCRETYIKCKAGTKIKFYNDDYIRNVYEIGLVQECTIADDQILPVYVGRVKSYRCELKKIQKNTTVSFTINYHTQNSVGGCTNNSVFPSDCLEMMVYEK